jgi:indolepyruvate ferredoxin oxidoreductase
LTLFGLLARLRGLRAGPLDVFAWQAERRRERQLVAEFEATIEELLAGLDGANLAQAVDIARLPQAIRGFGPVKQRAIARFEAEHESLMALYRRRGQAAAAE